MSLHDWLVNERITIIFQRMWTHPKTVSSKTNIDTPCILVYICFKHCIFHPFVILFPIHQGGFSSDADPWWSQVLKPCINQGHFSNHGNHLVFRLRKPLQLAQMFQSSAPGSSSWHRCIIWRLDCSWLVFCLELRSLNDVKTSVITHLVLMNDY